MGDIYSSLIISPSTITTLPSHHLYHHLIIASSHGHDKLVILLIEKGGDLFAKDKTV